jgi:hypothetical protein
VASAVPYIGILPGIAAFIIFIILITQICNAVNALPEMTITESVPAAGIGTM